MSSTSNVQNLLVNVFRPTYRYDTNAGFTPALVMSNVDEIITTRLTTSSFTVTDSNVNTYIGSNAGLNASNTAQNTGLGFEAMAGAISAFCNVAIGASNFSAVRNAANNVGIGVNTRLASGNKNILIGPNLTIGDGSGNIIIGADISRGTLTNRLQIGTLLYGDLCSGFVGINKSDPSGALDISGIVIFRNKVGFQTDSPDYSLDVAGSIYVSDRFIGGDGTAANPLYTFKNSSNTGMYVPPSAIYGLGAFGISVNSNPAAVFTSNAVQFFQNLDVSGTFSASNLNLGGFSVSNGTAAAPTITFLESPGTGVFLADLCGLGFTTAGVRKMVLLSNGDLSAGRVLASDLSYSGRIFGSDPTSCNVIGGVTLSNGNVILTGVATNTNLLVPGWLRDTNPATSLDISGGNISNSGTTRSATFIGTTASSSNQIGGVTLSNSDLVLAGTITGSTANVSNQIGGVTLSNFDLCMSTTGRILGVATTSNQIGGVTLSNSDLSMSATGRILAPILRNALVPSTYDISGGNISNSGTTRSATFIGTTASSSNQIGGVTLSNFDLCMSTTGRILGVATVSNQIGGVTLSNSTISNAMSVYASNGVFAAVRDALVPTVYDISGGNISNSGTTRSATFIGTSASSSNQIGGVTLSNTNLTFAGTLTGSTANTSNVIGGVTLSNSTINNVVSVYANNGIFATVRDALVPTVYDISGGNISNSGTTRSSTFRGSNGSVSVPTYSFTSDPSTGLHLVGTSQLGFDTAGVQRMCISGNRVGIGTAAPTQLLDITSANTVVRITDTNRQPTIELARGSSSFGASAISDWRILATTSGGNLQLVRANTTNTITPFHIDGQTGAIGIGMTAPTGSLDVITGSIVVNRLGNTPNLTDVSAIVEGSEGVGMYWQKGGNNNFCGISFKTLCNSVLAERVRIDGDTGNVGINTTGPAYALDICGTIRALEGLKQGTNTWGAYSDERLKQDIQLADTSLCYSIVKSLPLRRFLWDASYVPGIRDRHAVGWIAQDVEKVFPRAVSTMDEFGFDDLRSLDPDQLYKTMYGALEKVIADKETLETTVASLRTDNDALGAKVAAQDTLLQTILTDKQALETNMSDVLARLTALEASQQSSGSTQQTPPTPPPPEEPLA